MELARFGDDDTRGRRRTFRFALRILMIWAPDGLKTVTDLIGKSSALKLSWVVVEVTMVVAG